MPRQGGQGKGKPKMNDRDLGKALIKKQIQGHQGQNGNKKDSVTNMMSILDNDELDDYIITAEMEGEQQEVHRVHQNDSFLIEATSKKNIQAMSLNEFSYQHLVIPRKPAWTMEMTKEEVDFNEKKAFLQWRRDIAALESSSSSMKVTPFEKNLDVWRQLWRSIERSDMIVQIVDARNPMLYYTSDLMKYVSDKAVNKKMMLIINKADFLTEYHRLAWVHHLNKEKLRFMFYSAKIEQGKLDEGTDNDDCDRDEVDFLVRNIVAQWSQEQAAEADAAQTAGEKEQAHHDSRSQTKILNRNELLLFLELMAEQLHLEPQKKHNGRVCVGMVGYPNVGKSSVINSLLGVSKSSHGMTRVGVSSTPGKTKYYQTLNLLDSDRLMLCDCPGLVFPSFMRSTGEMICAGILPINQMRDYIEPAAVIASRVPQHLLEAAYGITIVREIDVMDDPDRPPNAHEVLCAYCSVKGYVTSGTGRWDEFRACKDLLRDFADGRILYVAPPFDPQAEGMEATNRRWLTETEVVMLRRDIVAERLCLRRLKEAEQMSHSESAGHRSAAAEEGLQFVYGDGEHDTQHPDGEGGEVEGDDHDMVYDEDSAVDTTTSAATGTGRATREHKKLKHWGKKNKKNRDKDPYGDHNGKVSFVMTMTNRNGPLVK